MFCIIYKLHLILLTKGAINNNISKEESNPKTNNYFPPNYYTRTYFLSFNAVLN